MGVKEYELPKGRKAVFEFDENGVGKITLEAMDLLMGMVNIDLVRCGECKHSKEWYGERRLCYLWAEEGVSVFEGGYCNYGERRADEGINE